MSESAKRVTTDILVPSISWWKSPQVLAALAGIAGSIIAGAKGVGIDIPVTEAGLTVGLAALAALAGNGYFLYRRWKTGLDPRNPNAKLVK